MCVDSVVQLYVVASEISWVLVEKYEPESKGQIFTYEVVTESESFARIDAWRQASKQFPLWGGCTSGRLISVDSTYQIKTP